MGTETEIHWNSNKTDCLKSCISRGNRCNLVAFFRDSGECHRFKDCRNPAKNFKDSPILYIKTMIGVEFGGKLYKFSTKLKTVAEANDDCLRRGMNLVSIDSSAEDNFLVETVKRMN